MAAIVLVVVVVGSECGLNHGADSSSGNSADRVRWSQYPHTMSCAVNTANRQLSDPTGAVEHLALPRQVQVDQVSLTHREVGGQDLARRLNIV